mmetsp:Transcript_6863/g.26523  ORF Transcript_6863/g.26523 Transcript_6863/m.26523 type:complete len:208 (+) Transcript_6863:268-891(+)
MWDAGHSRGHGELEGKWPRPCGAVDADRVRRLRQHLCIFWELLGHDRYKHFRGGLGGDDRAEIHMDRDLLGPGAGPGSSARLWVHPWRRLLLHRSEPVADQCDCFRVRHDAAAARACKGPLGVGVQLDPGLCCRPVHHRLHGSALCGWHLRRGWTLLQQPAVRRGSGAGLPRPHLAGNPDSRQHAADGLHGTHEWPAILHGARGADS